MAGNERTRPARGWPGRLATDRRPPDTGSLSPVSNFLKIALYFVATLFLGALLAPPLYWAGQALGTAWSPLHKLAELEYRRYFDRAMFVTALALLWPAVRALRIGGWHELGLERDPHGWRHLAFGFVVAGGLLWLMGLSLWGSGLYATRPVPEGILKGLAGAVATAAVVACIEEGFFRGALQGLVGRTAPATVALVFVAALFAVLHFFKPPSGVSAPGEVTWLSGFAYLPKVFWQWGRPELLVGGLATLLAVGLVLGYARWRTRALWLPIGLHAGWVFGVKSFAAASRHVAGNNVWFGADLSQGVVPVTVVLLTGVLVAAWLRREKPGAASS